MNSTVIIEVRRGADRKLYPAHPLTEAEHGRAIDLAHALVHRDHLSVRQAQRVMLESYALRRSVGIIARDLRVFTCPLCADQPASRFRAGGQ